MSTRVLVLAGGKGTRMGALVPKALVPVGGVPIIDRILATIAQSGVDPFPAIVIGHDLEILRTHMGSRVQCVIQQQQRGTGHAVLVARDTLRDAESVTVFYGDHPLYSAETIRALVDAHAVNDAVITMTTVTVDDYEEWRAVYTHYGRILRDERGAVQAICEYSMCNEAQRHVREVNNGLYCFTGAWLWSNIDKLTDQNSKGEFLLTDLIALAIEQKEIVATSGCPATEGIGVNTPDEVRMAEEVLRRTTPLHTAELKERILASQRTN